MNAHALHTIPAAPRLVRRRAAARTRTMSHAQLVDCATLPPWALDVTQQTVSSWLGNDVTNLQLSNCRELEQSECCNLQCSLQGPSDARQTDLTLLLKRYHLRRLMQRIPKPEGKWRVSARSFTNEFNFLEARECLSQLHSFLQPYAGVPKVHYAAGRIADNDTFDRQYDFLFELLPSPPFYQVNQLSLDQAKAALTLLARFHAFFWQPSSSTHTAPTHPSDTNTSQHPTATNSTMQASHSGQGGKAQGDTSGDKGEHVSVSDSGVGQDRQRQWEGVFQRGGWWRKPLRPSVKYERIPEAYDSMCAAFPAQGLFGGDMATDETRAVMTRLRDSVDAITDALSTAPDKTLVHGDPKTSNLFFKQAEDGASLQAYAIDFQWVGRGASGLGDVVYCLYGGVEYEVLSQHESSLIDWYYDIVHEALRDRGLDPDREANRSWLDRHMALETLAYWATALPQLLDGLTPADYESNLGRFGWLTHEMDPRCAAWLARKSVESMRMLEKAGGAEQLVVQP